MNINELTSNVYGTNIRNIHNSNYAVRKNEQTGSAESTQKFADILSDFALSGDTDDLADSIKEMQESLGEEEKDTVDKSNVMNILTDAEIAKEYLESKTGRNLIISMVENEIAGIISGSNTDDN